MSRAGSCWLKVRPYLSDRECGGCCQADTYNTASRHIRKCELGGYALGGTGVVSAAALVYFGIRFFRTKKTNRVDRPESARVFLRIDDSTKFPYPIRPEHPADRLLV